MNIPFFLAKSFARVLKKSAKKIDVDAPRERLTPRVPVVSVSSHIDVNFYFGNFFRTREPDFTEKKGLPVVYIYSVTMENTLFELLLRRSYSG